MKIRYRLTLLSSGILLFLTIILYGWYTFRSERTSILAEFLARNLQIKNELNEKVNLASAHVGGMQRTVEKHLQYPALAPKLAFNYLESQSGTSLYEAPWENLPSSLQSEVGSLIRNPNLKISPKIFERDINAVLSMMPSVVAQHEHHYVFQWSYYYNIKKAWFLIYPKLGRADFLKVTGKDDIASAIEFYFDADGTQPVITVGPDKNPTRSHKWTPPYLDAGGKGMMVTLLAPVYLNKDYVGAVGTDVTLQMLESTFRDYPPLLGRALVVDNDDILLADSEGSLKESFTKIGLNSIFPDISGKSLREQASGEIVELRNAIWVTYPMNGTSWYLVIQVPTKILNAKLADSMRTFVVMAFGLFGALFGLAWIQNRRFTQPALRLAEFVDEVSLNPNVEIPNVPTAWRQWFNRVANTALERRNYLEETLKHASELEGKVEHRTIQLKEKNIQLTQVLNDVQALKLQQDGDYFLMSLLIEPLSEIDFTSKNIRMDFLGRQKKNFQFNKNLRYIGGDINVCHSIELGEKDFIAFINADAMGKSLQGAGGILVFASVFKSIIERTKEGNVETNPQIWLSNLFSEIHRVFQTFQGSMLISGVFCLLEEQTGILYYILSEHPQIVLYKDNKAQFIETNTIYPKLGVPFLKDKNIIAETYQMKSGESIIIGSDGRDDVLLGVHEKGYPIINQDESLFLRHVENAKGDLEKIYTEILKIGEQYDDISMIRIFRI